LKHKDKTQVSGWKMKEVLPSPETREEKVVAENEGNV